MNFEYTNTQQDYMAQTELICQDEFPSARSAHYFNAVFWSVLLVLAASASYIADSWILVFVFLAALVKYLHRSIPYSRLFRARVKLSQRSQPEKRIKLIVNEDGLHEEAEGIQSFAPWTSIKSYTLFRDILFVKLAGGLWAIIPRGSITPSSASLDDLIRVLKEKGVSDSSNTTSE